MTDAHEGMDDPRLVAEGELSLARLALDDAELQHAADHVANSLGFAPALPEAHELLAALAAHPNGGPALWPLDCGVYVGTASGHDCGVAGGPRPRHPRDGDLGDRAGARPPRPARLAAHCRWPVTGGTPEAPGPVPASPMNL
jgi:hypothetical protein